MASWKISNLLGDQMACYLEYKTTAIDKNLLTLPAPTYVDDNLAHSYCNNRVIGNYQWVMSSDRIGFINNGGESKGSSDLQDLIITAIADKHAGGRELILGLRHFSRHLPKALSY